MEIIHFETKASPDLTLDFVFFEARKCIVCRLKVERIPTRETTPCTEPPPRVAAYARNVYVGDLDDALWRRSFVFCQPLRQELSPLNVFHRDVTWDKEPTRCGAVDVYVVPVHAFGIEHDGDVDSLPRKPAKAFPGSSSLGISDAQCTWRVPLALVPPGSKPGAPRPVMEGNSSE